MIISLAGVASPPWRPPPRGAGASLCDSRVRDRDSGNRRPTPPAESWPDEKPI